MGRRSSKKSKIPRSGTLLVDMGKPVILKGLALGKDGSIKLYSDIGQEQPRESHLMTTRDRPERPDKGPKVLNRSIVSPEKLTLNPNIALNRYKYLLAVDTNKPEKELPAVVFTGFVLASTVLLCDGSLGLGIHRETVIEFHNLNAPPERFGWAFICQSSSNLPNDSIIGIVVDSDLGDIPLMNRREIPIFNDYYLPDRFELLHATDKGGSHFTNLLIKLCDKNTRQVARQIVSKPESTLPVLMKANTGDPFTHYRVWERLSQTPV